MKLLSYLRPYRKQISLNILFSFITVFFSLISLVMIVPFLQLIFDKMPLVAVKPAFSLSASYFNKAFYYFLSYQIIHFGKNTALIVFCCQVCLVFFLKNLFRYSAAYFITPVKNGIVKDIRILMYKHLLKMPMKFIQSTSKGEVITRMTSDLREIENGLMSTMEAVIISPLTIVFYLGYMLFTSSVLTLFVLGMVILTAFFIGNIGKTLKRQSTSGQEILGSITSIIDETIVGFKVILGFNASTFQIERFEKQNLEYYHTYNRINRRRDLSSPLTEFLAIIIVCVVMWFGASMVLGLFEITSQTLDAEQFIAYMIVFSQLISPAKSFSNAFYDIQKGMASLDRVHHFLDHENEIKEKESPKTITEFKEKITFKNVSFSYNENTNILKNVSLEIPKGKVIAIVGSSGAGKSTMVDLLPRFYDVSSGGIEIDGVDIRDLSIHSLRSMMGIVTQEAILFHDSIENNIVFGQDQVYDVSNAAQIANASSFIETLPDSYDSSVGERGSKLSGGERQRVTIARAVYKNPPILILDEATSALDAENEKLVQDAIQKMMIGRTCIIIAHRLATIQYADEIIVMQKGEIVERGTHTGLMNESIIYKRLVELQQFG
jgi:ATP-binding cassette, subfamily B, bacterial MsbA